jgi:hypothetical protein
LGKDGITYWIGTWESDLAVEDSSNFQEVKNAVCTLEKEALKGILG